MRRVAEFDYDLPEAAIAQRPAEPRDAARLLDTRDLTDHRFSDLPDLLRPGDLVVVNETKVRRARLRGRKRETGGAVEALLLSRHGERWEALLRPARRLRPGMEIDFGPIRATILTEPTEGKALVRLRADGDIEQALEEVGELPLPPYIRSWEGDPDRYQTVFAASTGSAAAPTAGLHFTPAVLESLHRRGIEVARVDLEVGVATFRPLSTEFVDEHPLHAERFSVPVETARAVSTAERVVAVGTTVTRVLETVAIDRRRILPGRGETRLYLRPGMPFRVVDLLVTNFHLPRSSLLVLLAGFMGDGWRTAYEVALGRGYRFLSFGDAMICAREGM